MHGRQYDTDAATPVGPVAAWAAVLVALTVAGAAWLNLTGGDYRDFSPAILAVAYAPAVAALLVASFGRGRYGVRSLLGQLVRWRAGVRWYALALLGPIGLAVVGVAVFGALGGDPPTTWLVVPSAGALLALLGPLVAGSLGEELGWRGFAQPRLQSRWGVLGAAVAVGVVWSLWHLWPALTPVGLAELSAVDVGQTFVRLISTSVLYAWLYVSTRGCLPVVLVAHAGHNIAVELMPPAVIGSDLGALILAGLYLVAALAVVPVLAAPARGTRVSAHSARGAGGS